MSGFRRTFAGGGAMVSSRHGGTQARSECEGMEAEACSLAISFSTSRRLVITTSVLAIPWAGSGEAGALGPMGPIRTCYKMLHHATRNPETAWRRAKSAVWAGYSFTCSGGTWMLSLG